MIEDFIGPRGKKIVQIAAVIGAWGAIAAILALMAGFGEGGLDDFFTLMLGGVMYQILLSVLLIFIVLGAYVSAGLGDDPVEGIYYALASSVGGTILAQIFAVIIFLISGKGHVFDPVMHFMVPALIAVVAAILGSTLRIIQDVQIEISEGNEQQTSNDENRIAQDATAMQLHAISSNISRQHEARLNQIESILQGNRFTQLLYGQKMGDTDESVDVSEIKPNPFAVLDGAEKEI